MMPGPFTFQKRPKRKTTALSYSLITLTMLQISRIRNMKNGSKVSIKIEKKFDVLVSKVATMTINGKLKQMTTRSNGRTIRTQGRRSSYKKSIIT